MPIYIAVIPVVIFLFLFFLERVIPLREPKHSLVKRLVINVCITALAFGVRTTVVQPTASFMQQWTAQQSVGLVHLVKFPLL